MEIVIVTWALKYYPYLFRYFRNHQLRRGDKIAKEVIIEIFSKTFYDRQIASIYRQQGIFVIQHQELLFGKNGQLFFSKN